MNLNQITLAVKQMNESNAFYLKMGFTQIVDSPRYSRFVCPEGNSTFSLSLQEESLSSSSTIYFEDKNLDDLVKKLQSKSVKFDQQPTDESYLWREAVLHDPSGNKIILYWAGENRLNPPWRVEIKG